MENIEEGDEVYNQATDEVCIVVDTDVDDSESNMTRVKTKNGMEIELHEGLLVKIPHNFKDVLTSEKEVAIQ